MKRKALITGITGQDGSYLTEFLIDKGYEVHGIVRRSSTFNRERIDHHFNKNGDSVVTLHYGDLHDQASLVSIINKVEPDEIYNLAAMSHVAVSFDTPVYTADTTGVGALRLFDAVRMSGQKPKIYQAGSSEMFGKVMEIPQKETTPFYPRSPYGVAKSFAHWTAINYRESYNIFISNGILFNHESPRRGENFVSRKISLGVAAIKLGLQEKLKLGNLEAKRDWGFAGDYVEAMWLMLQQDTPDDFVIATGKTQTVRDFCKAAFGHVGLNWEEFVIVDPKYFRPAEVDLLIGDSTKAQKELKWTAKYDFDQLVKLMVDSDIAYLKQKHGL